MEWLLHFFFWRCMYQYSTLNKSPSLRLLVFISNIRTGLDDGTKEGWSETTGVLYNIVIN